MKKSVVFAGLFLILFLPLISAQFGFGYGFSLEGFIDNFLNSSASTYILLFFILFTVITLILSRIRFFQNAYRQPNAFAAGVVSFCISALAIYYLYQSGFQGESLLSWLGLSGDALGILVLVLVALVAIFLIWKLGFKGLFFFGGLVLILTAFFTELIYEEGWAVVIGIVLLVIGLLLWQRTSGYVTSGGRWLGSQALAGARRKPMWAIAIIGIILTIGGFSVGSVIVALIGILLMIIGFFGRRVYSETRFAQGRAMSPRRAEEAAYREEAWREQERMRMQQEEATRINAQVDQIRSQIQAIERDIRRYQRALRNARSAQQEAAIQNAIVDLDNQRRGLLNALKQLTQG